MMMLKKVIYEDGLISQIPAPYNRGYQRQDTFPAHHCEVIDEALAGRTLATMLVRVRCPDPMENVYYGGYYLGYEQGENMNHQKNSRVVWAVAYNRGEHFVWMHSYTMQELSDPRWQIDLCGSRGNLLGIFGTQEEAVAAKEKYLACRAVEKGTYCYNHNPMGVREVIL